MFLGSKKSKSLITWALLLLVVGLGIFGFSSPAQAFIDQEDVLQAVGWLAGLILWAVGKLLLWAISFLIWIANYNGFTTSTAVANGWVIVRDISNMFFVVVLLVIAFATVLRVETYSWKRLLPKLLLMAILVNFSKTIAAFFIDIAQVVMMTFVTAFSQAGGGNFTTALYVDQFTALDDEQIQAIVEQGGNTFFTITGAFILAVIFTIIALIVVLVMLVVLLFRIVMLWLLVVLSPLAYLLSTFPAGARYAQQWWEMFSKYVIVGPILAFFLWLSLATLNKSIYQEMGEGFKAEGITEPLKISSGLKITAEESMVGFAVSIGLLIASLVMTQQLGVMGSGLAGQAVAKLQAAGTKPLTGAAKFLGKTVPSYGLERASAALGVQLSPTIWVEKFKEHREMMKKRRESDIAAKGAERAAKGGWLRGMIGVAGSPRDFFQSYWSVKGMSRWAWGRGGKGADKWYNKWDEARKKGRDIRDEVGEKDLTLAERLDQQGQIKENEATIENNDQFISDLEKGGPMTLSSERVTRLERMKEQYEKQLKYLEKVRKKLKKQHDNAEIGQEEFDEGNKGIDKEEKSLQEEIGNNIDPQLAKARAGKAVTLDLSWKVTSDLVNKLQEEGLRAKSEAEQLKKQVGSEKLISESMTDAQKIQYKLIKKVAGAEKANKYLKDQGLEKKMEDNVDRRIKDSEKFHKEAEGHYEKAVRLRSPKFFYAERERRSRENEELAKLSGIDNKDELITVAEDALQENDKIKFNAAFKKATNDANDNEFFNHFGYDPNLQGMQKFQKEILIDKFHMGEQESLSVMTDISYLNEKVKHWNTARVTGMERGRWRWYTPEEHAHEAMAEISKINPREVARWFNRLAYGYETPRAKYDLTAGRDFHMDLLGAHIVSMLSKQLAYQATRGEWQKSAMISLSTPESLKIIAELQAKGLVDMSLIPTMRQFVGKGVGPTTMELRLAIEELFKKYLSKRS